MDVITTECSYFIQLKCGNVRFQALVNAAALITSLLVKL